MGLVARVGDVERVEGRRCVRVRRSWVAYVVFFGRCKFIVETISFLICPSALSRPWWRLVNKVGDSVIKGGDGRTRPLP